MKKIFFTIAACVNLTFLPAQIISFTNQGYRVEGERLAQKGMSGLAYALDGVFPGVQVVRENINGQTIPKLTYHGTASGLIDMTVYVNGIEYVGSLDMININDIESVTLLREGQNVKYGHRSAEGVILIEMKKARAGKFSLTFQNQTGITTKSLPYYDVINDPKQMAEMIWEREYVRTNSTSSASNSLLLNLNPRICSFVAGNNFFALGYKLPFIGEGYLVNEDGKYNPDVKLLWHDKWRDEMVSAGFRQENHIAVSGGDKLFNARGSFGFVHEDGYLDATGTDRFSGLVSLRSEPVSWVNLGVDLQASLMDSKQREQDYYYVHHDSPFRPIYNRTESGEKEKVNDSFYYLPHSYRNVYYNPMVPASSVVASRTEKMLSGNIFSEFNYRGFYAGVKASGIWWKRDISNGYEQSLFKDIAVYDRKLNRISSSQYAGWKGSYNENYLSLTLGHEDFYHDGFSLISEEIKAPYGERSTTTELLNDKKEMVHGYNWTFGLNYDYDHRFLVHAGALIEKQPFFFDFTDMPVSKSTYYTAGAQWNLWRDNLSGSLMSADEQEAKSSESKALNQLSLFADWGLMKPDEYKTPFDLGYSPEEFSYFTAGVHSRMFNRAKISLAYFQREIENLVAQRDLPPTTGYAYALKNTYRVKTSGVDLNMQVDVIKSGDCFWQLGLNMSHYRQIVKRDDNITDGPSAMKGTDLHRYGKEYLKYELGLNYGEFTKTGEQKADKKPEPDLFGGLTTNVRYKNFDLNLGFTFAIGGYVYDQTYRSLLDGEQLVWHKDMEDRWRPGADNANAGLAKLGASNRNNPYVLTSGSYLSMDYVNLGYNFEKPVLKKLGLSGLRVSFIGDNLFLISARKGFDPRSVPGYGFKNTNDSSIGSYSFAYSVPLLRTFSLGLTMTL